MTDKLDGKRPSPNVMLALAGIALFVGTCVSAVLIQMSWRPLFEHLRQTPGGRAWWSSILVALPYVGAAGIAALIVASTMIGLATY